MSDPKSSSESPDKLTIYWLNDSRASRIVWLAEELGIPYDIVKYERDPSTMLVKKSDLKEIEKINPLGKFPFVKDKSGDVWFESGFIVDKMISLYSTPSGEAGSLKPSDSKMADKALFYQYFSEGSLEPYLVMGLVLKQASIHAPFLVRPVARGIANGVNNSYISHSLHANVMFVENDLKDKQYLAGDILTGADIMMVFCLESVCSGGATGVPSLESIPNIRAYIRRVHARPAYKRYTTKVPVTAYSKLADSKI